MSNRPSRPRRFHRPEPRRYPMVPGVIPADTPEWRAAALAQAHEDTVYVPGTVVHVLIYDRDTGLDLIAEQFGGAARTAIAAKLIEAGPDSLPVIAGRFDRRLTFRNQSRSDAHACTHDPKCE